jgi:acyl carrier protein
MDPTDLCDYITRTVLRILSPTSPNETATLGEDDDLYAAGMESLAVIRLMLQLEDEFGVEVPDEALQYSAFSTVARICAVFGPLLELRPLELRANG